MQFTAKFLQKAELIPVYAAVALEGYQLAESLQDASRRYDWANERSVDVDYNKGGGRRSGPKYQREKQDAMTALDARSAAYQAEMKRSKEFEERTGVSVVKAWEAQTDKLWPYYKMRSGEGKTHYVPKEQPIPQTSQ